MVTYMMVLEACGLAHNRHSTNTPFPLLSRLATPPPKGDPASDPARETTRGASVSHTLPHALRPADEEGAMSLNVLMGNWMSDRRSGLARPRTPRWLG